MRLVSFTANKIKDVEIQKYNGSQYVPEKASLVEINKSDSEAVHRVANTWDTDLTHTISAYVDHGRKSGFNVYALTNQKQHFTDLEPKNVLGMIMTFDQPDKKNKYIACLQTHPEDISVKYNSERDVFFKVLDYFMFPEARKNRRVRPYKHIGQALVNYVIEENPQKTIQLDSETGALGFYEKLGFKYNKTTLHHELSPANRNPLTRFLKKFIGI
jgi:hypothetical protein